MSRRRLLGTGSVRDLADKVVLASVAAGDEYIGYSCREVVEDVLSDDPEYDPDGDAIIVNGIVALLISEGWQS